MSIITINHPTCRKLIIIQLPVQRFFHTAVILLTFRITFAILKKNTLFIFFPIITVIGIEMPFVKSEFWKQYRISCQLVVVIQQSNSAIIYHKKYVQVISTMGKFHFAITLRVKVIFTFAESMEHNTITRSRPVKWYGRSHSSVRPAVLVLNGNNFTFVREPSILDATTIEILIITIGRQCKRNIVFVKHCGIQFFNHRLVIGDSDNRHAG